METNTRNNKRNENNTMENKIQTNWQIKRKCIHNSSLTSPNMNKHQITTTALSKRMNNELTRKHYLRAGAGTSSARLSD